jgi:UDPglucose 6-dehydrogenase
VWANIKDVSKAIWMDERIWEKFLNAWIGYGWSCFPKDVKSLIHQFQDKNLQALILENVDKSNSNQLDYFVKKILEKYNWNIKWKNISILWVAFKADTDDLRESKWLAIINKLLDLWAILKVYDYNKKALENFEKYIYSLWTCIKNFVPVSIWTNFENTTKNTDFLVITVEDKRILEENFFILLNNLKDKTIFDWRNILDREKIKNMWFKYFWIWY